MQKYTAVVLVCLAFLSCGRKEKENLSGGDRKDGTYFTLTVNGQTKNLENIHYARAGKNIHLATWGKDGFPNLNVTLTAASETDFRDSYPYYWDLSAGTCIILYGLGTGNGYESHWWDCPIDGPLFIPSPGAVIIKNIERNGNNEFISGSFTVEQYQPQGDCPYAEVKKIIISATFRLKRAQ